MLWQTRGARGESIREKLGKVKPVIKTSFITTDDIREIIYNALEGIYLYDYISSGQSCVDALNTYEIDLEMMLNPLIEAIVNEPKNRELYEFTVFNFTNSLGMFSPILRNCYLVGGQVDQNWGYFVN